MQSKQNLNGANFGNLTFGFDIGIASVGCAEWNKDCRFRGAGFW